MRDSISLETDFKDGTRAGLRTWAVRYDMTAVIESGSLEGWAWVYFRLREEPDDPYRFPHGKWATLQHLESMLIEAAQNANRITA
jgi:hypothetical protein